MILITNNKKFLNYKKIEVEFKDDKYIDVFYRARDYIHTNYKLITHPLYGNITPTTTIYRSIVLEKSDKLDLESLEIIEGSIEKVLRILNTEKLKLITDSIREDLEFIDYTLISETLDNIIK